MVSMVLSDSTLESLTPSVNAPLMYVVFGLKLSRRHWGYDL